MFNHLPWDVQVLITARPTINMDRNTLCMVAILWCLRAATMMMMQMRPIKHTGSQSHDLKEPRAKWQSISIVKILHKNSKYTTPVLYYFPRVGMQTMASMTLLFQGPQSRRWTISGSLKWGGGQRLQNPCRLGVPNLGMLHNTSKSSNQLNIYSIVLRVILLICCTANILFFVGVVMHYQFS